MPATLVWFRRDLRLHDNPALTHAAERDGAIIPVFILDKDGSGEWAPGSAQRAWLHESLSRLDNDLQGRGLKLTLRAGSSAAELIDIAEAVGADEVVLNRDYVPASGRLENEVIEALGERAIRVRRFGNQLLHEPDNVRTSSDTGYRVFTPFWKSVRAGIRLEDEQSIPRMGQTRAPSGWPRSAKPEDLRLLTGENDGRDLGSFRPGEDGARERLNEVKSSILRDYYERRNRPDVDGTSRLSPHLAMGEVSIRSVWQALSEANDSLPSRNLSTFRTQLGWREFSYHVLHHNPDSPTQPLRPNYGDFPWRDDDDAFDRWCSGTTGYPMVDAGMRQLAATGWMHNRVRMVVASFLTKHLLIRWQQGARFFWDHLFDADLANNTMGWQWSAGSGADAQPFFRIFNPITQGEKFDLEGKYVRRWIPELAKLPNAHIHSPWTASEGTLDDANVVLGEHYPEPIVDHRLARERALSAYQSIRDNASE